MNMRKPQPRHNNNVSPALPGVAAMLSAFLVAYKTLPGYALSERDVIALLVIGSSGSAKSFDLQHIGNLQHIRRALLKLVKCGYLDRDGRSGVHVVTPVGYSFIQSYLKKMAQVLNT
jgi:hypothetical protein